MTGSALSRSFLFLATFFALHACHDNELGRGKEVYPDLPETAPEYITNFNNDIPLLGRVLFYDKQLSLNNSISCASCHKQAFAFADNVAFSRGFENRKTGRNSMPIQNLSGNVFGGIIIDPGFDSLNNSGGFPGGAINSGFFGPFIQALFWDGRETDLNTMVLKPVVNHIEMGISDVKLWEAKISDVPYYKDLFSKAYGSDAVTHERIADALSWFLRSITSQNTKFDRVMFEGTQALTPMEMLGQTLFMEKYDCNACHQVQQPNGYILAGTFANIGLEQTYSDNGLGAFSKQEEDNGKFKIPSLRNVALTAPYMHDGRFNTLGEVIDHYSTGMADHPNLDPRLRVSSNQTLQMNITSHEKQAIIAFLNTLTDFTMVTDPKFSDPFKVK